MQGATLAWNASLSALILIFTLLLSSRECTGCRRVPTLDVALAGIVLFARTHSGRRGTTPSVSQPDLLTLAHRPTSVSLSPLQTPENTSWGLFLRSIKPKTQVAPGSSPENGGSAALMVH